MYVHGYCILYMYVHGAVNLIAVVMRIYQQISLIEVNVAHG